MAKIPVRPKFEALSRRMQINVFENFLSPDLQLPPLYLQINPQSMSQSFQKKINRYETLNSHIEEHWGDELDVITCANTTGGFIHEDYGYDTIHRRESLPYMKFQDVVDIYRNNGNTHDEFGRVTKKGTIGIFFDEGQYFGYFESFDYTEDATNPYRFTFNFTFKVERSTLVF